MNLFLNACLVVLVNLEMLFLLEVNNGFGIKEPNRVTDANLVPLDKYSFVVLVNLTIKQTYCTGSLISEKFVLTVAHCVSEESDTSIRVYRGNIDDTFTVTATNKTANTNDQVTIKGYEERQSVAIIQPYLYRKSGSIFDIALIQLDKEFEGQSFVKTTLLTPFIQYNVLIKCKAVGYDVNSVFHTNIRENILLTEYTLLVKKISDTKHKTDGTCSGISWIVQQDEQYIEPTFANSSALLLCNSNTSLKTNLNGIAVGNINVFSPGTPNRNKHHLAFPDICPYLSWIRSHVGPSVIRSPGPYGKRCFCSSSSITTEAKIMAWFVVIGCMLLYL